MKKSDIAMIILIASISVLIAFFVTRSFFGNAATEPVTVKTIRKVSPEVAKPDSAIFNSSKLNPAVEVQIQGK